MKQGRSLMDLAQEIERQNDAKRDFISPSRQISITTSSDGESAMRLGDEASGLYVGKQAHAQLGDHLGIPKKFYESMRTNHPDLLDHNVNTLLGRDDSKHMVRVLDGTARAVLSNSYRPLDNYNLLGAVLPVLSDLKNVEFRSQEVTDNYLYLKVVMDFHTFEVKKGDVVRGGMMFCNSEIGLGKLRVWPFLERLVCLNGLVRQIPGMGISRNHRGSRQGVDFDFAAEYFTTETRELENRAFFAKVKDTVNGFFVRDAFERMKADLIESTTRPIEGNPEKVVEVTAKTLGLTDGERSRALTNLLTNGDLTQWGLVNAVTEIANTTESYDRATELETLGGKLIDMSASDWKVIARAA